MHTSQLKVRVVGVVFLAALLGIGAFAAALYSHAFRSTAAVTLLTDRAGLVMETGNDVKLRGVAVGSILSIEPAGGGGAELTLGLDPDDLGRIPANVDAQIVPTTAFGTKYVDLTEPAASSPARVAAGDVLRNRAVTVEVNDVFANLSTLLESVDPAKVNATLGELAHALDGRGDRIAGLAGTANGYLSKINGKLPAVQRDLVSAGRVAQLYADVAPDLLHTLDNATVTGRTIVDQADQLDTFLLEVTTYSRTADQVLGENKDRLITVLDLLRPTTDLLHEYDPELTCFITGLDKTRQMLEPVIGGFSPEMRLNTTVTLGQAPYEAPRDLPKIGASNPPACHGLPELSENERPAPHVRTDTGADPNPSPSNRIRPGQQPAAPLLFGPLRAGAPAAAGNGGN